MPFDIYSPLNEEPAHTLKLIQLPKDLVAYMKKEPAGVLQFKAPTSSKAHLVLCTDAATYAVRQMNHSNTQLVLSDMAVNKFRRRVAAAAAPQLLVMGRSSYQYEVTPAEGSIETSGVPVYDGVAPVAATKTVADVMTDSPVAPRTFVAMWHAMCGSEVGGRAVLLAPPFVTEVLHTLICVLIAARKDAFALADVAPPLLAHSERFTGPVAATVVSKFCTFDGAYRVDAERVAVWFGVQTLRGHTAPVPDKELLLAWKSSLPPFFNASLDLALLAGNYCRPAAGTVRYLDASALCGDIHGRIKELFSIVREWAYDEFLPYVAEFIPPTKKPEAVILKYAKKKRVGKKFVVCPR